MERRRLSWDRVKEKGSADGLPMELPGDGEDGVRNLEMRAGVIRAMNRGRVTRCCVTNPGGQIQAGLGIVSVKHCAEGIGG